MTNPSEHRPDDSPIDHAMRVLPHVPHIGEKLSQQGVVLGHVVLTNMRSGIPQQVRSHLDSLVQMAISNGRPVPGQPDAYVFSRDELRSVLGLAAFTGSTQTAYALGASLIEASQLQDLFAEIPDEPSHTD